MTDWSTPPQLAELGAFYEAERDDPSKFSDEELIARVRRAFWSTNCWSFVEQAFAIIAPACARRPQLVRELIRHPIQAMVYGGLDDPSAVVAQGVACATKSEHYIEPTEEGKFWLIHEWPKYDQMAREVFQEVLDSLEDEEE